MKTLELPSSTHVILLLGMGEEEHEHCR